MLLKNKKFAPLFWTQFLGALNDNIFKNALVILVTYKGIQIFGLPTKSLVAMAGGIFILPFFLFSPISGQLCDRYERATILRLTKWWELVAMLIAVYGFYTNSFVLLLVVLFLMGFHSTLFGPLKYSMIPDMVDDAQLLKGNAYVAAGTFVAILVGTVGGGLAAGHPEANFYISMSVVGVAILGLISGYMVPRVGPAHPELEVKFNPLITFKAVWDVMRENGIIFQSIVAISWFWFLGAAILSVLPIYCHSTLGVTAEVVTLFLALFTLGVGTGAFICERLSKGKANPKYVVIGAVGMSLFLADLSLVVPAWQVSEEALVNVPTFVSYFEGCRLIFDFFTMSIFAGHFFLPLYTLLQGQSNRAKRSRIIASNNIGNAVFMVVSSLLVMGFYGIDLEPEEIFLVMAVMNLMAAGVIFKITRSWRLPQ